MNIFNNENKCLNSNPNKEKKRNSIEIPYTPDFVVQRNSSFKQNSHNLNNNKFTNKENKDKKEEMINVDGTMVAKSI